VGLWCNSDGDMKKLRDWYRFRDGGRITLVIFYGIVMIGIVVYGMFVGW